MIINITYAQLARLIWDLAVEINTEHTHAINGLLDDLEFYRAKAERLEVENERLSADVPDSNASRCQQLPGILPESEGQP
jgi:hypothetical protein